MNNKVQKATVAIVAVIVFLATFFGSTREQVVVEAKKIVTDSNNINNNYLIGIQSLENALGAQGLVILDIRDSKEYNEGHIPGAINVSWNQFVDNNLNGNNTNDDNANGNNSNTNSNNGNTISNNNDANSNNNNVNNSNVNNSNNTNDDSGQEVSNYTTNWTSLINKNTLTKELQSLGITNQSTVVIYGDSNGDDLGELGKFSWMFRMIGIQSKMLNGGYKNWESQGFKTTTKVPTIEKSNLVIQNFVPVKTIKKDDIKKNISKIKILELVNDVKNQSNTLQNSSKLKSTVAVNANTNTNDSNNNNNNNVELKTTQQDTKIDPPVKGVIQIKLSDMLNPNGTIKPVNQLQSLFESKGISKNDIVLFYNTNKGNLAFLTLMLNMSGYTNIQTYNANLGEVASITNAILESKNNDNIKQQSNGQVGQNDNTNVSATNSNTTNASTTNSNSNSNSNSNNNSQDGTSNN